MTFREHIHQPWDSLHSHLADAPATALELKVTSRPQWTDGIEGKALKTLPGSDSGVMTVLLMSLLLLAVNLPHYSAYFKTFARDLFSLRDRQSLFEDNTLNETRISFSLTLIGIIAEGLFITVLASAYITDAPVMLLFLKCVLMAAAYYLAQNVSYRLLSFAFLDREGTSLLMRGFNASQSLMGMLLIFPAAVLLFNANAQSFMLLIAVFLFAAAKIIFIIKAFRIFYVNYFTIFYFILYLCTLELCSLLAGAAPWLLPPR